MQTITQQTFCTTRRGDRSNAAKMKASNASQVSDKVKQMLVRCPTKENSECLSIIFHYKCNCSLKMLNIHIQGGQREGRDMARMRLCEDR